MLSVIKFALYVLHRSLGLGRLIILLMVLQPKVREPRLCSFIEFLVGTLAILKGTDNL